MKKIPSIKIKDLKVEHVYHDGEPPQEWLEQEPGGSVTDEDIKTFFSGLKDSEIESVLSEQPQFLKRVKKVLNL